MLEPFSYGEVCVKPRRGFPLLLHGDTKHSFSAIRHHFNTISFAQYVLAIISKLTAYGQPNSALFKVLLTVLTQLDQGKPLAEVESWFYYSVLYTEGLIQPPMRELSQDTFKEYFESYANMALPQLLTVN